MGDPKHGVLLGSGVVGASITVAVGAALALRLQRRDDVVVDFFGDGASQRGDFHEGLNFAGVFKLPIVFVLENNGYAEHTPVSRHFAGGELASRAQGYGFPGVRIDGNDVGVVYETVQTAVARARGGEGPTLVECMTYRYRPHVELNRPEDEDRDAAEIERWREKDPITRFRTDLAGRGILNDALIQKIGDDVKAEIDDAVKYAEESPFPVPEEVYDHVYAPESPELVVRGKS
jgi:pyruvate dehydrogenase E1 component alpha subunit